MDITLPAGVDVNWPARILAAIDLSPESMAALAYAARLARATGATVVPVHAVGLLEEGGYRPRPDLDGVVTATRQETACPAAQIAAPIVEDGPAPEVVVRVAGRVGADLIVIGRRGIGGALGALGSTSEHVVAHSAVPVLVVPHAGTV
jgi:nucleotide-binding universal stress UspA family protein